MMCLIGPRPWWDTWRARIRGRASTFRSGGERRVQRPHQRPSYERGVSRDRGPPSSGDSKRADEEGERRRPTSLPPRGRPRRESGSWPSVRYCANGTMAGGFQGRSPGHRPNRSSARQASRVAGVSQLLRAKFFAELCCSCALACLRAAPRLEGQSSESKHDNTSETPNDCALFLGSVA